MLFSGVLKTNNFVSSWITKDGKWNASSECRIGCIWTVFALTSLATCKIMHIVRIDLFCTSQFTLLSSVVGILVYSYLSFNIWMAKHQIQCISSCHSCIFVRSRATVKVDYFVAFRSRRMQISNTAIDNKPTFSFSLNINLLQFRRFYWIGANAWQGSFQSSFFSLRTMDNQLECPTI